MLIAAACLWKGDNLMLGNLYVGEVVHFKTHIKKQETPYRGWLMRADNDGEEVGWYATEAEARAATEAAMWEALKST